MVNDYLDLGRLPFRFPLGGYMQHLDRLVIQIDLVVGLQY